MIPGSAERGLTSHLPLSLSQIVANHDLDGFHMRTGWPDGFEKKGTLKISTIGRRHDVTTWFAVDSDGRLFVATQDTKRDWVKNAMKNLSVEITICGATHGMKLHPLKTDLDRQYVNDLYAKKYLSARLGRLLKPKGFANYEAFELQPE